MCHDVEALEIALIILTASAFATAVLSAIIGMGGGITLLAVLTFLVPAPAIVPIHAVVQFVSNSTRSFAYFRYLRWKYVLMMIAPAVVGMACALQIYKGVKFSQLKVVIGLWIFAFLLWRRFRPKVKNLPNWSYYVVGFIAGFVTLFVGANGPLLAPFFLRDDLKKEEIIGTKAAVQMLLHVLKIPGFLMIGFAFGPYTWHLALMIPAVIIGTFIGKRILHAINEKLFVVLFELTLGTIACYLVIRFGLMELL